MTLVLQWREKMYKYLVNTLIVIAVFSLASPVSARVKYVRADDDGRTTPTIEVFQTEDQDGRLHYTRLRGSNFPDPTLINLRVKVEAKCRWAYRLNLVNVRNTSTGSLISSSGAREVLPDPGDDEIIIQDVPFTNGNRTLGTRVVDLGVPLENYEDLITFGNEQVAARAGSIIEENNIRANDWSYFPDTKVGLTVRCGRVLGYTGLDKWYGTDTHEKIIRVVYRGASAEFDLMNPAPGDGAVYDPLLPPDQLGNTVNVNASLLALTDDTANDCQLDLSGTFTTNGTTTIFYHLIDDKGVMSQLYKVAVDQTHVAFVYHPIDLSEREPEGPSPAMDRGFSAVPTDRLQGFYQIEVVSPDKTTSDIASYNIEPCYTRPDAIGTIVRD
jgi:hypothetical protein